jgi:radical SAM protein with 4Fe4S-binding SPASM domain
LSQVLGGIDRLNNYPHPKYITCIVSDVNRNDVMAVIDFANERQFVPVVGAYHWDVDRYGKADIHLQYQKEVAKQVFAAVYQSGKIPEGYFQHYVRDNVEWLSDNSLPACDAGRYSIVIDASGNVAPCLALPHQGNLLSSSLSEILDNFDRESIAECSHQSSCNMLCSRVIGSCLRNPIQSLKTGLSIKQLSKQR